MMEEQMKPYNDGIQQVLVRSFWLGLNNPWRNHDTVTPTRIWIMWPYSVSPILHQKVHDIKANITLNNEIR